jgi:hypothetical protein
MSSKRERSAWHLTFTAATMFAKYGINHTVEKIKMPVRSPSRNWRGGESSVPKAHEPQATTIATEQHEIEILAANEPLAGETVGAIGVRCLGIYREDCKD